MLKTEQQYPLVGIYCVSACFFIIASFFLYRAVPNISAHFEIDSTGYDMVAKHFYYTNNLLDPAQPKSAPIQPVGYHFFVGLLYKIFGIHPAYIIWTQIFLCLVAGWLLVSLTQQLFGTTVAKITALLLPINIGFLVYAQFLLAEILLVTILLGFWHRLFTWLKTDRIMHAFQTGLLLGISVLVKPIALMYVWVLLPIVWCTYIASFRKKIIGLGALLCAFYIPVFGYMLRNYFLYDTFAFAPMMELNIYQCFLSKVISRVENISVTDVINNKLRFTGTHALDTHGWDHARSVFFHYLTHYPHIYLLVWLENVLKTMVGLFTTQLKVLLNPAIKGGACSFFAQHGTMIQRLYNYIVYGSCATWVTIISFFHAGMLLVQYICATVALILLGKKRRYSICSLFVSFILVSAFMTGMDGCCRYRMTFEPLLLMLAAFGIYAIMHYIKKGAMV